MKQTLLSLIALVLLSFNTNRGEPKTVTITFSLDEINIVYQALGELPAKTVEALRFKIYSEAQKQLSDTIYKKK